jgi:aromatic ring-opening dioxygenase catalytic subunit (LigB family)
MQVKPQTPEAPVLFFPHGGGPLPLLGDPGHKNMVEFLGGIARTLPEPSAILVVSAHWEEGQPTITAGEFPPLIYDYYGFPEESYAIQYPAPGNPALARETHRLLTEAGIEARLDAQRGFDHGLFVPLKIMYPGAHRTSTLTVAWGKHPDPGLGVLVSQHAGFLFRAGRARPEERCLSGVASYHLHGRRTPP